MGADRAWAYGVRHLALLAVTLTAAWALVTWQFGGCAGGWARPMRAWQPQEPGNSSYAQLRDRFLHMVEHATTGSLYDELGTCDGNIDQGCSPANAIPFDAARRATGTDWPLVGHTMVGHLRVRNVRDLLRAALDSNVPGGFMELGSWRGGLCIYAKALMDSHWPAQNRTVYAFDAFQRLPGYKGAASYLAVDLAQVERNFAKYGLLDKRVVIVKGMFKNTLPAFAAQHPDLKLAVLRIDSNFYDSHQDSFYYLYEAVAVGGYVIMDDILSHAPVQAAWADFCAAQGVYPALIPIDSNGAYFQKGPEHDVRVNRSKMQPPRDCNVASG